MTTLETNRSVPSLRVPAGGDSRLEAGIKEYKHALANALFGPSSDNVFLVGKAGVSLLDRQVESDFRTLELLVEKSPQ